MTEFKQVLRKRLRVLMAEADMNAEQLSAKSGVSIDAVRQYLRGETAPLQAPLIAPLTKAPARCCTTERACQLALSNRQQTS